MVHLSEHIKVTGDIISVATVSATLMLWLPPIASFLTVIWMIIRLYETRAIQKMFGYNRIKRTRETDNYIEGKNKC